MNKNEDDSKPATAESVSFTRESTSVKSKRKNRGKKRKSRNSQSSSESEDVLADNSVDVDRSLHASPFKNNLDETSVRKIIKSSRNLVRDERSQIIALHGQGFNISQIADQLHMSRNTVRLWIRRYEAEGVLEDRPRAPRPHLISEDNLQYMVDTYRQINACKPTRVFAEEYNVSLRTVHRALQSVGLTGNRQKKMSSKKNKK